MTLLFPPAVDKYIAMAKEKHGYNIEQVGWGAEGWEWDPPNGRCSTAVAEPELCLSSVRHSACFCGINMTWRNPWLI